jgi:hypothetical protein
MTDEIPLENPARVCAWCRRLSRDGEWVEITPRALLEDFTAVSHGLCDECRSKMGRTFGGE